MTELLVFFCGVAIGGFLVELFCLFKYDCGYKFDSYEEVIRSQKELIDELTSNEFEQSAVSPETQKENEWVLCVLVAQVSDEGSHGVFPV